MDELALPEGFGDKTDGNGGFSFFKLKKADDELIFRILPSMKGLLKLQKYSLFFKQHFGWVGRDPADPSKNKYRPFECIQEKRQGMVVKECPACILRSEYEKKLNALVAEEERENERIKKVGKEKSVPEPRIQAELTKIAEKYGPQKAPLNDWLKAHGCDSKHRMYVMDKTGKVGIFQVPHNLKVKLDNLIKKTEAEFYPKSIAGDRKVNIKVNGRVGVWLKFTRTGKASPTSDDVTINMVDIGDEGAQVKDFHKISDEMLEHAKQVLPCLVEQLAEIRLSDDKVQALVTHCRENGGSCDPDFVDSVMGAIAPKATRKNVETADPFADGVPDVAKEAVTKAETPAAKAEEKTAQKPSEAVKAAVEAPKAEAPKTETKEAAVKNGADMNDSQFDELFA